MLIVAVCTYTPSLFLGSFTLRLLHLVFKYSRCLSSSRNICWAPPGNTGLSLGAMGLHRVDSKTWENVFFSPEIQEYTFYFISSDAVSGRTFASLYLKFPLLCLRGQTDQSILSWVVECVLLLMCASKVWLRAVLFLQPLDGKNRWWLYGYCGFFCFFFFFWSSSAALEHGIILHRGFMVQVEFSSTRKLSRFLKMDYVE